MRSSRILSLGRHLPSRVVTNDELGELLDTTDAWIRKRTGIRERRWVVPEDGGPADLAAPACREALDRAGLTPSDVDLVLFATLTPDRTFPGSGCLLLPLIGCEGTPALDIRNQCTGFLYALSVADQFVRTGAADHVLVVGSEVHSTGLDLSDAGRHVAVLFGDGAAAAVVGPGTPSRRIHGTVLHADGTHADVLTTTHPGSRHHPRLTAAHLEAGLHFPRMDGRRVFRMACEKVPDVVHELLQLEGACLDDVDLLVPHQANQRINAMVGERLGLSPDKVFHDIATLGNTTAASIPLALYDAEAQGLLTPGSRILLTAFGAGLTWGASLLTW